MTAILIAEQDTETRHGLERLLAGEGVRVVGCASLAEARDAVRTTSVAAAVINDGMLGATELLEELRRDARHAHIPVLPTLGRPEPRMIVAWVKAQLAKHEVNTQQPVVLVVDDTDVTRGRLAGALESSGWAVLTARSGNEGMRAAVQALPAAIIVAESLADMDGPTVIRRMRLDPQLRTTPCVLMTTGTGSEPEILALDAGADAFVRRSDDLAIIIARIASVLRGGRELDSEGGKMMSMVAPRRVLVVDDDEDVREALGDQLRDDGYDAVLASSGTEALERLASTEVDCILLDRMMPGLSGPETCRRIKGAPGVRDIPLIMMTASDGRAEMIDGLAAGADDFIVKTSGWEVLRARLQAQLRRRRWEHMRRKARDQALHASRLEAEAASAKQLAATQAALAQELALTNRRIEEANRLKSVFLAHMSHELRTPLNAIIGFTEMILDGVMPRDAPEHDEYLSDILTSGKHLLRLINDVLDLAKVEAGKLDLQVEAVDPRALIGEVLAVLLPTARTGQLELGEDCDPCVDRVTVDPVRFKQVAYNYLSNALKFTPPGGKVTLALRPDGPERFILSVRDTGPGIAAEDIPHLFTEFGQLREGKSSKHGGTGLGLALTRRLVEAHGGTVAVSSTPGQGSTFSATFPRTPALPG